MKVDNALTLSDLRHLIYLSLVMNLLSRDGIVVLVAKDLSKIPSCFSQGVHAMQRAVFMRNPEDDKEGQAVSPKSILSTLAGFWLVGISDLKEQLPHL